MADRTTGKNQGFVFNNAIIPITKVNAKVNRKLADVTDSGDYQSTPDMIFPSQIPVSAPLTLSIEGRYRYSSTPGLISAAQTSLSNIPAVVSINGGSQLCNGNFDLQDFEYDGPFDDVVTFTATLISNGQWTPL